MRVVLENGNREVTLEDESHRTGFLQLVIKALEALDYTEEDVRRFLDERDS